MSNVLAYSAGAHNLRAGFDLRPVVGAERHFHVCQSNIIQGSDPDGIAHLALVFRKIERLEARPHEVICEGHRVGVTLLLRCDRFVKRTRSRVCSEVFFVSSSW